MLFLSLLLVFITCPVTGAKKHHHKHEDVPRFVIPRPESRQETAFIPEAISVVKKSGSIVGTELPGAYGEDFEIDNGSESGTSGSGVSGSGSDKDDVLFVANNGGGEAAETAGKYGNNEQPKPGINPANAFVNNMKDADDEETEAEKGQATATAKTETNKAEKTDKTSEKPKKTVEVEKTIKAVKPEKTEKQRSSKKRTKVKAKSSQNPDENNMISKIDAIARQIEKVEHREKLDRKEEATLKVAKKVAKKVIKDMKQNEHRDVSPGTVKAIAKAIDLDQTDKKDNAPAEEPKGDAFGGTQLSDDTDDIKEEQLYIQNFKKSQETSKTEKLVEELIKGGPVEPKDSIKNSDTKKEISKSPEMKKQSPDNLQNGTEKSNVVGLPDCPWGCFWKCQSYCPAKCCNNPFKCELSCREMCTPYCPEKCCAPGAKRLPKLRIAFDASTASTVTPKEWTFTPAESSYQQEKEQSEKLTLRTQLDALKKTSLYAAELMGLPTTCPIACARICLPGLCKHECCGKAHPIGPPLSCPMSCSRACYPGICSHQCCTRPPPSVYGIPQISPQSQLVPARAKTVTGHIRSYNAFPVMYKNTNPLLKNGLTLKEQLILDRLQQNNALLPGPTAYSALMFVNRLSKPKLKALLQRLSERKPLAIYNAT